MYKYETHLHTSPASKCAFSDTKETLGFYKNIGYDGVCVANHFYLSAVARGEVTYEQMINAFFDDVENSKKIGKEVGIKVFGGLEMTDIDADFLVYGVEREFFLTNSDFVKISLEEKLTRIKEAGGLIIHAHPFRRMSKKRAVRIFPYWVEGVEVYNTNRVGQSIKFASAYAQSYGLLEFAGSDNHGGAIHPVLGGMESTAPIADEFDFIAKFRAGELHPFYGDNPLCNNEEGLVESIILS